MRNIFLVLAIVFWCSIFFVTDHYLPWVSWHGEALAFVAAIFLGCAALAKHLRQVRPAFALSRELMAIVGILGLVLVQAAFGMLSFWGDVWILTLYILLCISGVYAGFLFVGQEQDAKAGQNNTALQYFAIVMYGTALLCALEAVIQSLDLGEFGMLLAGNGARRRPGSNLAQPNHLATILMFGVVSAMHLRNTYRLHRVSAWFIFFPLLLGLIISESRSGLLSLLLLAVWNLCARKNTRLDWACSAAGMLSIVCGFVFWPTFWNAIQINNVTGASIVSLTSSGRMELWEQVLKLIWERPLIGWGFRQVSEGHNWVASGYTDALIPTYTHNILLDFMVWFGVPVALAYVFVIGKWAISLIRRMQNPGIWYCLGMLVPVSVHAMFEFPHAYAYILLPTMFAVGALSAMRSERVMQHVPLRAFGVTLVFFFLLSLWSAYEYLQVEEDFRVARFSNARVGNVPIGYEEPNIQVLTQLSALVEVVRMVPKRDMTQHDIEIARKVALHFPWSATVTKYAEILALNGQMDESKRQLRVIRAYFGDGAEYKTRLKINDAIQSQ